MADVKRLLIVEDEPELREVLTLVAEQLGVVFVEARDGQEAVEILKKNTFEAVLCDIVMPNMSGLECLAKVRAMGNLSPFVFMTGFSKPENIIQAVRLGAIDFLHKPFSITEITGVLEKVLDVGAREMEMSEKLEAADPVVRDFFKDNRRMIGLLRAVNNRRKTG